MNHETKSNWLGVLLFIMLVYVFTDIYYQIKTMIHMYNPIILKEHFMKSNDKGFTMNVMILLILTILFVDIGQIIFDKTVNYSNRTVVNVGICNSRSMGEKSTLENLRKKIVKK